MLQQSRPLQERVQEAADAMALAERKDATVVLRSIIDYQRAHTLTSSRDQAVARYQKSHLATHRSPST